MQTDRQIGTWTDMTKELVAFRDYANALKENRKVPDTEKCAPNCISYFSK